MVRRCSTRIPVRFRVPSQGAGLDRSSVKGGRRRGQSASTVRKACGWVDDTVRAHKLQLRVAAGEGQLHGDVVRACLLRRRMDVGVAGIDVDSTKRQVNDVVYRASRDRGKSLLCAEMLPVQWCMQ